MINSVIILISNVALFMLASFKKKKEKKKEKTGAHTYKAINFSNAIFFYCRIKLLLKEEKNKKKCLYLILLKFVVFINLFSTLKYKQKRAMILM